MISGSRGAGNANWATVLLAVAAVVGLAIGSCSTEPDQAVSSAPTTTSSNAVPTTPNAVPETGFERLVAELDGCEPFGAGDITAQGGIASQSVSCEISGERVHVFDRLGSGLEGSTLAGQADPLDPAGTERIRRFLFIEPPDPSCILSVMIAADLFAVGSASVLDDLPIDDGEILVPPTSGIPNPSFYGANCTLR